MWVRFRNVHIFTQNRISKQDILGEIFPDSRGFYLAVDLSQARPLAVHQDIGPEYLGHQIQSNNDRQHQDGNAGDYLPQWDLANP